MVPPWKHWDFLQKSQKLLSNLIDLYTGCPNKFVQKSLISNLMSFFSNKKLKGYFLAYGLNSCVKLVGHLLNQIFITIDIRFADVGDSDSSQFRVGKSQKKSSAGLVHQKTFGRLFGNESFDKAFHPQLLHVRLRQDENPIRSISVQIWPKITVGPSKGCPNKFGIY